MRKFLPFAALALLIGAFVFWLLDSGPATPAPQGVGEETALEQSVGVEGAALEAGVTGEGQAADAGTRIVVESDPDAPVLRGVVRLAQNGQPVGGVEVRALSRHPAFAEMELRFRELLTKGFWQQKRLPEVEVLATTVSKPDGSFELTGLEPGRVFLDARSERYYTKSYQAARLARGDEEEGVEVLLTPGAQVAGQVLDPDGKPVPTARVVLRPDVNSFLEQITERSYRWFEASTDEEGKFVFPGVPPGQDYALSAAGPGMAPAEAHNIDVAPNQRVNKTLIGARGAKIVGTVSFANGKPAAGALVGFVYMDISRILFTVGDGNLVTTDAEGRFVLENVGPGQVAVTSMVDGMALAEVQQLFISEGGVFETELVLGDGYALEGSVIDDDEQPVPGATVTVRVFDRSRGFDLSAITQLRPIEVTSDKNGRFIVQGLTANRFFVQAEKPGYLDANRTFMRREGQKDELVLKLGRGRFVTGVVVDQKGEPITRFRVNHRPERDGRRNFGPRWARPQRDPNPYTDRAPWSRGGEEELRDDEGRFRIGPIAARKWRVSVEAEGYLRSEPQTIEVKLEEDAPELRFELTKGAIVRGQVVSKADGKPIPDVQVTWRKDREPRTSRFIPISFDAQPEDLDFMALSSAMSSRSTITDSKGRFELSGMPRDVELRFTARHPDYAKDSVRKVKFGQEPYPEELRIELGLGGSIEGYVRGLDDRPVPSTMVVAFSLSKGVMRSGTTNDEGYYKIDALVPSNYLIVKTKMSSLSPQIMQEMMGNLRLKSTTVKEGRTSRVDIQDRTANGVDVVGVVTSGGQPVPRAFITLLGQASDGPFGVGVRSGTCDEQGSFTIASVPPGNYLARVTRFSSSRPVPASLSIDVPEGVQQYRVELKFPDAELRGIVVGADGQPVQGVRVRAVADDDRPMPGGLLGAISELGGRERGRSNEQGEFTVRRLQPGRYRLRAESRGRAQEMHGDAELSNIVVSEGQKLDGLRIVLPAAAVLSGRVLDGNGQPVVGASVQAIRDSGQSREFSAAEASSSRGAAGSNRARRAEFRSLVQELRGSARTDGEGRFRIRGLALGLWSVEVEKNGLSTTREDGIQLTRRSAERTIVMRRGGRVRVQVIGLDGKKLALGNVRVLNSRGQEVGKRKSLTSVLGNLFRKKDDEGNAWLDFGTLPPDTYTLEVKQKKDGKDIVRTEQRVLQEGEEARWKIDFAKLIK
jgi:protocatechuate 3,4-dioxygenase beta subunit